MAYKVGIIMGSLSDLDIVKTALDVLTQFGVESDVVVSSAHRTPDITAAWSRGAKEKGYAAIIAFAGAAAHLAGVAAAHTNIPVIAVPISATALSGLDALLSSVQMPGGIPVAVMAIGKAGAKNAALFACQIIALKDEEMFNKLENYRSEMREQIERDNERLKAQL
ncbi:MAG: 5-(carboxyamino)imidazole ribonucleotide mutase [Deferribacteraceae bacterium]|jgi:5-(carboxyamino)imidazole ribonucleotide mutase|nr:5-(carboxyamino)imidazole ribonucleotide mutase [Deferribacteraceae bacterium]